MLEFLLSLSFSYLAGSIPCGLLLSILLKHGDLRKVGSGNIGATNALRAGGKKLGLLTLLCDMLKAIIPLVILIHLGYDDWVLSVCGTASVLGHIFPVWLRFQGGKGVATALAVLLVLTPFSALSFALVWLGLFIWKRIVSVSSIAAVIAAMVVAFFGPAPYFIMSIILCALVIYRHTDNMRRLIAGTEPVFRR